MFKLANGELGKKEVGGAFKGGWYPDAHYGTICHINMGRYVHDTSLTKG